MKPACPTARLPARPAYYNDGIEESRNRGIELVLTDFLLQDQIYKSARLTPDGRSSRQARADDVNDDEGKRQPDEDTEAGPAPPPEDGDAEDGGYGPELPPDDDDDDDEEGRFFGGGMTAQEAEVLDYVNEREREDDELVAAQQQQPQPEKFDLAWLRKTALSFERLISRNAEQRARFEGEPERFIASEAELDGAVKALSILAEHPALYPEFARLGCAASLVGLLAHDNTDVAVDAVEIIGELTDDDVAADDAQWAALVDALLDADLLGLLVSNLDRLDEAEEVDRGGVYHALGVVENLCSGRAETAERVAEHEGMLRWLLRRIQVRDPPPAPPVGQNRQYAAEVLAVLAQASAGTRRRLAALDDAVDVLLQLAAAYRKRDPARGEEQEYMENLFEALTCLADGPEGKARLVEAEGVELCLIMLREGGVSRPAALRLLDHATTAGPGAAEVCRRLVEAGGLKNAFTLFMRTGRETNNKKSRKKKNGDGSNGSSSSSSNSSNDDHRTTEHLVGIFASLLRRLPADSPERVRTLAKFVEKDYEKTARLVELRHAYAARVAAADEAIRAERRQHQQEEEARRRRQKKTTTAEEAEEQRRRDEEMADGWFSRRLDAGLFTLQTIDVILAWLVAEDGGAAARIRRLLADRDESLRVVRDTIQEQIDGMDPDGGADDDEESTESREMLSTLVEFLQ